MPGTVLESGGTKKIKWSPYSQGAYKLVGANQVISDSTKEQ